MTMKASTARLILISVSILYGLAIIPCGFLALMTSLAADGDPPLWLFNMVFWGSLAVPVSMLVVTILGWILYSRANYLASVLLLALPLFIGIIPAVGVVILDG